MATKVAKKAKAPKMTPVNVSFDDVQLGELKRAATLQARSVPAEIRFRLFPPKGAK